MSNVEIVVEDALRSRIAELEPLDQRVTLAMHAEHWRDGVLQAEEDHLLTIPTSGTSYS
jgi:hypothetical protein